jgi:hypothetical protein
VNHQSVGALAAEQYKGLQNLILYAILKSKCFEIFHNCAQITEVYHVILWFRANNVLSACQASQSGFMLPLKIMQPKIFKIYFQNKKTQFPKN